MYADAVRKLVEERKEMTLLTAEERQTNPTRVDV